MSLSISLLGSPCVEDDGTRRPTPKGRKAWGLLAYLVLTPQPSTRDHLADLLFSHADDPLGALRWNLAELRRMTGLAEAAKGKDLSISLPAGSRVDVLTLTSGTWTEALALPGLTKELLAGMSFGADPAFDTWLMLERTRLNAVTVAILREAAASCLADRPDLAIDFASKLVALEPFDEPGQELLIRGYAAAGRLDSAVDARERCIRLFEKELGVEPGAGIKHAADAPRQTASVATAPPSAAARAQLDLGHAAIRAGAVETGIESLRAAVAGARRANHTSLLAEGLFALGYALIHSVRGRDGEASALLHEALEISAAIGEGAINADCHRELGYIEMLIARYERALPWLAKALELSEHDAASRAWTFAYQSICYSDTGRYLEALDCLRHCLRAGDETEIPNQTAYALCLRGRIRMLRGDFDDAREDLQRAVTVAERHGWVSILPWPLALLADVELIQGNAGAGVEQRLEHALSLAQRIDDPCWEGAALRGLGLIDAARGDTGVAIDRLTEASRLCVKYPDGYLWMQAYALDALCDVATEGAVQGAERWINDLECVAGRTGMKEFLARAYLYRTRLGQHEAAETARLLAREVTNPALETAISQISES